MKRKQVITLQTWWMGELKALTQKVLKEEEKRQARIRKKNEQILGSFDIERREDIDDLYAYGTITDKKREKLIDLWEQQQAPDEMHQAKIDMLQEMFQQAKEIIREQEAMMDE